MGGEELLGFRRVEHKVPHAELQRLARSTQPRDVGLWRPARRHELRVLGQTRHDHAEDVVALGGLEFVQVVDDEHERR